MSQTIVLCSNLPHCVNIYSLASVVTLQQKVSHPWHEMPRAPIPPHLGGVPSGSGWRHPWSREVPFAMFVLSGASGSLFVWWNGICRRWDDDWEEEQQYDKFVHLSRQSGSQPSCKLITWLWIPWAPSSTSWVVRINPLPPPLHGLIPTSTGLWPSPLPSSRLLDLT